jgi:hypothetical protein
VHISLNKTIFSKHFSKSYKGVKELRTKRKNQKGEKMTWTKEMKTPPEVREYFKVKQREYRARKKARREKEKNENNRDA